MSRSFRGYIESGMEVLKAGKWLYIRCFIWIRDEAFHLIVEMNWFFEESLALAQSPQQESGRLLQEHGIRKREWSKGSVCGGEHAKFQCAENAHSKSCRKFLGPAGHLLTADWCSQGVSARERKGNAYAMESAGQKASTLQHGAETVPSSDSSCLSTWRPREEAGQRQARSHPSQFHDELYSGF